MNQKTASSVGTVPNRRQPDGDGASAVTDVRIDGVRPSGYGAVVADCFRGGVVSVGRRAAVTGVLHPGRARHASASLIINPVHCLFLHFLNDDLSVLKMKRVYDQ